MNDLYYGENGFLTIITGKGTLKINRDNFYLTDKYGNIISLKNTEFIFTQNSPTYDELYEHWIKIKENN